MIEQLELSVVCGVVAYKEKIGFKGQFLIEPKPKEPSKHQYDYGNLLNLSLIIRLCFVTSDQVNFAKK